MEPLIGIADLARNAGIEATFDRYSLGWIDAPFESYISTLIYEFYTLYAASKDLITQVGKKAQGQPLLAYTIVICTRVDLFEEIICIF